MGESIRIQRDSNGVARMLTKLRTSKGDYWIKQRFSSIVSLFIPRGSEFFPLTAVPYGMDKITFTKSGHLL